MFAIRRISVALLVGAWLMAVQSPSYAEDLSSFQSGLFNQTPTQSFNNSRNFAFFQRLNQIFRTFRDVQGFSLLAQAGNQLFVKSKTTGLPQLRLLLRSDGIFAQRVNEFGQAFGNFFRAPREASHQAFEFFATQQDKLGANARRAFQTAAVNELGSGRQFGDVTLDCNQGVTPQSKVNALDPKNPSFDRMDPKKVCAATINYLIDMIANPVVARGPRITANDIGANGRVTINLTKYMRPEHVALIKAKNYKTCNGAIPGAAMSLGDFAQIESDPGVYNTVTEVTRFNDATDVYRRYGVNLNFPRRFMGPNNPFARETNAVLISQAQTGGNPEPKIKGDTIDPNSADLDGSGVSTGIMRFAQRFLKNGNLPFYITTDQKQLLSGLAAVGSSIAALNGIATLVGVAEEWYAVTAMGFPKFGLSTTPQNDGKRLAQTEAPASIAATAHKDPRLRSVQNGVMCLYCHNNLTAMNGEKAGTYRTSATGPGIERGGINGFIKTENGDSNNFLKALSREGALITKAGKKDSAEPLPFLALEKQIKAFSTWWADRELGVAPGTVERLVKSNPAKWKSIFGIRADQPITADSVIRRENWVGGGFCEAKAALQNQIGRGNNQLLAQRNAGNRVSGNLGRLQTDSPTTHSNSGGI